MAGAFAVGHLTADDDVPGHAPAASYAFRGERQAGIVTPAQDRLHFVALDVTTDDRDQLIGLLKAWTDAAVRRYG